MYSQGSEQGKDHAFCSGGSAYIGKVEGLTKQIAEGQKQSSYQLEQLVDSKSLKYNVCQTRDKAASSKNIIAKTKAIKNKPHANLKKTQGLVGDLNNKFCSAKETPSSKHKSNCCKLKMEQNCAKRLLKEM